MLNTMSAGMLRTCGIFALTLLFSLPLGVFVALGRMSRIRPLQWIIKIYIAIMRGTPLMLQLLVWYFGPYYLFGWSIRGYRYTAIILGFVFNYAAYFAEIYRSGIESMPPGQYEAAEVLGYSKAQSNHPCKGHFPGLYPRLSGSVFSGEADCRLTNFLHTVCDCRGILLYRQLCGGLYHGTLRESA